MAGTTGQISNWAGGGATTTLGAVQMGIGMYKQRHNKRPTYEIPQEIQQNLTQAQADALQGLPEEQRQMFLSNIERGNASALSQIGSRSGGLAGVAAVNQNANDSYGKLLAMDSQARMANKDKLYGMRQNLADYKDQAWQVNKLNPYYEATASNNAMIGAGMQNVSQGFQQGNQGGGADFSKASSGKAPEYGAGGAGGANGYGGGQGGYNYDGGQQYANVG